MSPSLSPSPHCRFIGLRRRSRRLQPGQFGQVGDADSAQFHCADVVEGSRDRHGTATKGQCAQVFHGAVRPPGSPEIFTSTWPTPRMADPRSSSAPTRRCRVNSPRSSATTSICLRPRPPSGVSAGCASRSCSTTPARWQTQAKSAALQTATNGLLTQLQGAVTDSGRRLCLDHSVRERRQRRRHELQCGLGLLGNRGARSHSSRTTHPWDAINGTCSNVAYTNRSNVSRAAAPAATRATPRRALRRTATAASAETRRRTPAIPAGPAAFPATIPRTPAPARGHAASRAYTTQTNCQNDGSCGISGQNTQNSCQNAHRLFGGHLEHQKQLPKPQRHLVGRRLDSNAGYLDSGRLDTRHLHGLRLDTRDMDGQKPQHLEWLRDGPRQSGEPPTLRMNYDTNASPPDPVTPRWSSLYPAEQYSACPQAVKALSYDWTAMNTLVDNMSPNGNTNQAIGLQLGWMSLVGGGPFPTSPAWIRTTSTQQVIILLTDGLNTQDRWYTDQSSIDTTQADDLRQHQGRRHRVCTRSRSTPAAIRPRRCCRTAPAAPDKFYPADVGGPDDSDVQHDRHQPHQVARRANNRVTPPR